MDRLEKLDVFIHNRKVGTMGLYQKRLVAFEYDSDWLSDGFSISPFSLPLEKGVFMPKIEPFDGVFGVFNDSLPDGWGRLLVDRLMRKNGIDPYTVGNLERLAIVGDSGIGAITYKPVVTLKTQDKQMSLDEIARECERLLKTNDADDIDALFAKGGSSGGARPKIFTKIDNEDWIIKFPSTVDINDIGKQEYEYAICAKECGIEMSDVKLFSSNKCSGYFGTKRFDITEDGDRIHMVSVSGLLETSHRIPNLDYNLLMKLTLQLTGSMDECEKLYRLMCFNVYAHNRDDHSKNFSYIYDEEISKWKLSPAYDLTYSNSIGGEHATTVNGNGVDPGEKEILEVAKQIGISKIRAKRIHDFVRECVESYGGKNSKYGDITSVTM